MNNKTILLAFFLSIGFLMKPIVVDAQEGFTFQRFTTKDGLPSDIVYFIAQDDFGFLWIATDNGLCKYDGYQFEKININSTSPNSRNIESLAVYELMIDSISNHVLFNCGGNIYRYDRISEPLIDSLSRLPAKERINFREDDITLKAVQALDRANLQLNFIHYTPRGTIWAATSNGLVKISNEPSWKYYLNDKYSGKEEVTSILQDKKNTIWIGTENRTFWINEKEESPNFDISSDVNSIIEDQQGDIWAIASRPFNSSILKFNPERNSFQQYPIDQLGNLRLKSYFSKLTEDRDGTFWIGTGKNTLIGFDPRNNTLDQISIPKDKNAKKGVTKIGPICEGLDGNLLWISANGPSPALLSFSLDSKEFKVFSIKELNSDHTITDVFQSDESSIWIASSNGLFQFDIKNNSFRRFSTEEGLPTNIINSIEGQLAGKLWLGTQKGIVFFDAKEKTFTTFSYDEGLRLEQFNRGVSFRNKETGELFFGSDNGAISFYPDSLISFVQQINPSPVLISTFSVFGQKLKSNRAIEELDTIRLNSGENYLELEFLSPNIDQGNVTSQYRYQLSGVDKDWVYASGERRYVNYNNLQHGKYTFNVQTKIFNREWEDNSRTLTIIIPPYFWQTWWFKLILGLGLLSLIGGFTFLRFNFLSLKRKAYEKELQWQDAELKALRAQMNPHFIFNAMNSIQKFLTTNEQENAMIYLSRFAQLIRSIFEQSKKKEIALQEEIEFLNAYLDLEKLRFKKKITVNFKIEPELLARAADIKIPPLLIQPVIENAFKHGLLHKKESGLLFVHFSHSDKFIFCTIEDNGVGRQRAKELSSWKPKGYQSSGLTTTIERLKIINQAVSSSEDNHVKITDLLSDEGSPSGTKVELQIKYHSEITD